MQPQLKAQFNLTPQNTVRDPADGSLRQETASAEYNPSPDNKKPVFFMCLS
jgi:hypothetical protein